MDCSNRGVTANIHDRKGAFRMVSGRPFRHDAARDRWLCNTTAGFLELFQLRESETHRAVLWLFDDNLRRKTIAHADGPTADAACEALQIELRRMSELATDTSMQDCMCHICTFQRAPVYT